MISGESLARNLAPLYSIAGEQLAEQVHRWESDIDEYKFRFGKEDIHLFSTPGRIEIGGNHTDHNHGKVLAAGINLDAIAVAAACPEEQITIYSLGYDQPFVVSLSDLAAVPMEKGTTTALIRGIAARFRQLGHAAGGFHACIDSAVPVGSGLSSSASIEVLIATILNALYNGARLDSVQIALIGQYAENVYFGKPSGLMDQIACAEGGIVKIDFKDPTVPLVEKIDFDFAASGYCPLVVDTGGSHAGLAEDYAAIPREMESVAAAFDRQVCRQISEEDILDRLAKLRIFLSDRAILRALHFLRENQRVDLQVEALRSKDMARFLRLIEESANSSFCLLQNCTRAGAEAKQGIPLALALTQGFVQNHGGACRVHGGGFAGTILVFLPAGRIDEFRILMESAFGSGCVKPLRIRTRGSLELGR